MQIPTSYLAILMLFVSPAVSGDGQSDFFEKRIRPILVNRCFECHSSGSKKIEGGLLLDSRAATLKGGHTGPIIQVGDPDSSLLIQAVRREGTLKMPPETKLSNQEIADLTQWVRDGAFDPRTTSQPATRAQAVTSDHWAFQPLRKPAVPGFQRSSDPAAKAFGWVSNPIDQFVLASQRQHGLTPFPQADRRTLLRRVYFDLVGYPPSPAQIHEFLNDKKPDAFERVVDQLLASPGFGERWGRYWLDVARYAESSGGGRTLLFQNAWRYRDYVIRSFNADKPFDQFMREQIAGDLLSAESAEERRDQLIAAGFLVLGPINYELQDKELLRMEVVDEQIETIGRAFLGLTLGCARCHDHKFDPIPTRDYYALAGIFRSTKSLVPGNVSGYVTRELPVPESTQLAIERHRSLLDPLKAKLKDLEAQLAGFANQSNPFVQFFAEPNKLPGRVIDDSESTTTGQWVQSTSVKPYIAAGYIHDGNQSKGAKKVVFEAALPSEQHEVRLGYTAGTNRATNVTVKIHSATGTDEVRVNQRKPGPLYGTFVSLGKFEFSSNSPARIEILTEGTDGHVIADAVQFLTQADLEAESAMLKRAGTETGEQGSVEQLQRAVAATKESIRKLEQDAPPPIPIAMSVQDEEQRGDYFVCIRGSAHNLGEKVPRGFLSILDGATRAGVGNEILEISDDQSGRLQLADWISMRSNPLPARVVTNRIWRHMFGEGLVRSTDNFGSMGELPSHPELLDWLASQFQEEGWSFKQTIRRIALSQTYRQASRASPDPSDPDHRYLSGVLPRRLDAEAIHDTLLRLSGSLDHTMGGLSIRKGTTSEFGYDYGTQRRAVYTPVFRNTLYDLFAVFDFANPNLVTGDRPTSTLPTQSLFMMNSPFVMDRSEEIARRAWGMAETIESRIQIATEFILGRPPTDGELELTLKYLTEGAGAESDRWNRVIHAFVASVDFRYIR